MKKQYCQWCGSVLEGVDCKVCQGDGRKLYELAAKERYILTEDGYTRLQGLGIVVPEAYKILAKVRHCAEGREHKEIVGKPISQDDINNWLIDSNAKGCV